MENRSDANADHIFFLPQEFLEDTFLQIQNCLYFPA